MKKRLKDNNLKVILEKSLHKLIDILEIEKGNNEDEIMLMNPKIKNKKRKNYEFLGFQDMDSNLPDYYPNIKSELETYIKNVEDNYNE